ncbi:MAG TPA: hypothetical protein VLK32_06480 [Bacillota bacterium]|nr:hypothetical protein [Bacillota bacterium]
MDTAGAVVGLVVGAMDDAHGLGLAIPSNVVLAFAAAHGIRGCLVEGHPFLANAAWQGEETPVQEVNRRARNARVGLLPLLPVLGGALYLALRRRRRSRDVEVILHR